MALRWTIIIGSAVSGTVEVTDELAYLLEAVFLIVIHFNVKDGLREDIGELEEFGFGKLLHKELKAFVHILRANNGKLGKTVGEEVVQCVIKQHLTV